MPTITIKHHDGLSIQDITKLSINLGVSTMREHNTKEEIYSWISKSLRNHKYFSLQKKEKSIIKQYIISQTGYTESHIDTLINIITNCRNFFNFLTVDQFFI